jgi:hypothetical protein
MLVGMQKACACGAQGIAGLAGFWARSCVELRATGNIQERRMNMKITAIANKRLFNAGAMLLSEPRL